MKQDVGTTGLKEHDREIWSKDYKLCFNVVPDEWVARCTRSPIHHIELEPNPCLRDKKTGRYFPPLPLRFVAS